jgi:hypothetical protein
VLEVDGDRLAQLASEGPVVVGREGLQPPSEVERDPNRVRTFIVDRHGVKHTVHTVSILDSENIHDPNKSPTAIVNLCFGSWDEWQDIVNGVHAAHLSEIAGN